jgi:cytochrome P450
MEAELRQRTDAILDAAAERGTCDFVVDVATELPLQAIARLLGVPQEDRHRLFGWANATLDYDDRQLGETSAKVQAAQAELFQYGTALLAEKRRCPADDILSAAALGRIPSSHGGDEALSDLEQQMLFNLLIAAGSETTRNSIALGFAALVQHPDQWRTLQQDRTLLPRAVEEMLRWASSTPYNRRTATRDVTVRGATIRAGDKVTLWWASANRDEDVFAEPFRFDVRRDPNPHLTFGYGNHFCLGANLARVEMRLVFEGLLERFADIALDGPIEWTRSNKHTGVRHMPVALVRRTERAS